MSPCSSSRSSFRLADRSAMRRLAFRLALSSRLASRLVSCRPVRLVGRAVWRNDPCGASSLSSCYVVLARASFSSCIVPSSRLVRLVLRCVGRGDLRFYPMSSGVLCRLAFSFAFASVPVRLRSSSFVVVGMGVSLHGACGEIELTKTAHFNALVISVSSCSCSCSCCVAMGIGPGRTGVRQGTGAGLFGCPFCRICPQVVSAN